MAGTISTTITSTYNLQAQYTTVLNTGAVIVTSGPAVTGTYVSSTYGWTLTNSGTILDSAAVSNGVDLRGIGNHVTNNAGGLISAVANAVYLAHSGATVINVGSIAASGYNYSAVLLGDGGYVSNAATGMITSTNAVKGHAVNIAGARGTVVNAGLITNAESTSGAAVNLSAGGLVRNAVTGRIIAAARSGVYITGTTGTVLNAGSIASAVHSGIDLNEGGYVSNASTGTIDSDGSTAIYVNNASGTVVNAGTIISPHSPALYVKSGIAVVTNTGLLIETGGTSSALSLHHGAFVSNAAGGTIMAEAHSGIYVGTLAATILNSGLIAGVGTTSSSGLVLDAGGYVGNAGAGTITSVIGNAIYMKGGAGTVVNAGMLSVPTHSAVYLVGAAGTVVNSGEIIGGNTADGVHLIAGGSVTNLAGGFISTDGFNGVAITGTGTVKNAGTINGYADHPAIYMTGGTGGVVVNSANISGIDLFTGGQVTNQSGGTIGGITLGVFIKNAPGTIVNAGAISGTTDAVLLPAGFADRLVVDPGAVFSGLVSGGNLAASTIVSTLELASAAATGTLESIGTQFLDFSSIVFDPGAEWFISGNTSGLAGTISGFALGDTIEVTGITATGSSYAGGILTLTDTSGSVELKLPGTFTTTDFTVTNVAAGADITVTCFVAGTRIRTEHGDIPVENLRAGERVMAHTGNERMAPHPIKWIGHRSIDCHRHPNPALVQPVRIRAGAFGPNRPQRDLLLSPNHAVFIAGVLIPVKYLINHRSIAQIPLASVEYFHVELPAHAVLLAENLPVESYLDAGDRANFANGSATATLFPDFATRAWEARGCANLVVTGPQLQAARALLDAIASARATPTYYVPAAAASA